MIRSPWRRAGLALCGLLAACALHAAPADPIPEAAGGASTEVSVAQGRAVAVTANPHATAAALAMLRQGGSAIDAAIAAQLMLGLVEPQSSGIGGGLFLLHWDARQQRLQAVDGRETAPARLTPAHFLREDGQPRTFRDALSGGWAVGTPGAIAALALAHQQHGRLPWATLFQPAITLAEQGFTVSPRLHALLVHTPWLEEGNPAFRAYFFPNGQPLAVGQRLRNPAYAATLRQLAHEGAEAFYRGALADDIVQATRQAPGRAGVLSREDLAAYQPVQREALCAPFLAYRVCSAPPPAGGLPVLMLLGLLERLGYPGNAPVTADAVHVFSEASRLAFADRDAWLADPAQVEVPTAALLAPQYLDKRAAQASPERASGPRQPGQPVPLARRATASPERPSTTHLSIVDADGNLVSMTSSIENAFGARVMVGGFLLNNQLTDFSFLPAREDGRPVANRAAPHKRPRSSMAPLIAFDASGQPVLALGSPGGSRIIDYVAQGTALALARTPLDAVMAAPRLVDMGRGLELEQGRWSPPLRDELHARGHTLRLNDQTSGLHGLRRVNNQWQGAADPRREGQAAALP